MSKKPSVRGNLGAALRPQAEAARYEFLCVHVTKEERAQIQQYCVDKQISVSQFLAEIMLTEALTSGDKGAEKVTVKIELELTRDELVKLELLTRFNEKDTMGEYLHDVLQPHFELQRLHTPIARTALRYYLSEYERHIVATYLAGKGMAARYYPALLALKAIAKDRDKHR